MFSVLTFNHKMHTGFFLTKVTRNRAIGLCWKQREKTTQKILPDACVSLMFSGNSSEGRQWIRQRSVLLPSTQLSRRGLQLCPYAEPSSKLKNGLKNTAPLGLLLFIRLPGCCLKCLYCALEDLSYSLQDQVGEKPTRESSASALLFPNPTTAQEGHYLDSFSAIQHTQYMPESPGGTLMLWPLPAEEGPTPPD